MAEQFEKMGQNDKPGNGAGVRATQPLKAVKKDAEATVNEAVDQASEKGRDLKERVVGLAEESVGAARAQAEGLAGAAREFASEATEALKSRADEQRAAGADYIGGVAEAIRRASREFDNDLPIAGVYLRKAASKVEEISDTVQQGDISTLVRGVQDFARRQPTAFLGIAVLAGFGAVRFLKSSGGARQQTAAAPRFNNDERS
ncbi:hypothetical protein [Rhodopseudomonas palustris]|uniref:Late embryogenesis abundant protein n=1 Tax=Rhodopseudomonas palustris TaxID=1076 RepID=A0A418UYN0_RHOPL|nr:hypothetical protein [Rhodopseudomonas palustris]RJF67445.1 hypothetical protein D4Q52_23135 [Rhodopseudomonas palustris]